MGPNVQLCAVSDNVVSAKRRCPPKKMIGCLKTLASVHSAWGHLHWLSEELQAWLAEHPEVTADSRPVPTPVRGSQVDRPPQLDLDDDSDVELVSQVKCPDSWPHDCCPRSPWDRPSPASTALDGSEPKESGSGAEGGVPECA